MPPSCLNSASLEDPAREPSLRCSNLLLPLAMDGSTQRIIISFIEFQSCSLPHLLLWFSSCLPLSAEQDQGVFFLSKHWSWPTILSSVWLRLPQSLKTGNNQVGSTLCKLISSFLGSDYIFSCAWILLATQKSLNCLPGTAGIALAGCSGCTLCRSSTTIHHNVMVELYSV